jgi:hemolysin D
MFENLISHFYAFRDSLKAAKAEEGSRVGVQDPEFLPAALEILDTPPNPLGRTILWVILSFLGLSLIWAIFGSVDIVATGDGKLIPRGQVKIIQTADGGIVRALHVADGKFVHKGDVLIELDPTTASAEYQQAKQALLTAEIDLARARVLADYAAGRGVAFVAPAGADPTIVAVQQSYLREKISEQASILQGLENDRQQRGQEAAMVRQEIVKLEQQTPIFTRQLESLRKLEAQGYAASAKVDEMREKVIGMQQDMQIRTAELQKANSSVISGQSSISAQRAKFANEALNAMTEAQANYHLRSEELKKASEKQRQSVLLAPVDGVVQQSIIHTVGGVVKPADALMVIVPREAELVVEAQIPGRDIGFIRQGQGVELKFEAFPFTRYGTAHGVIEQLNLDAVMDEKRGLLYTAIVHINEPEKIAGEHAQRNVGELDVTRLKPGMATTVEIKTGRRSIISFLLSPLTRRVNEAGRER